jgi:hypothetical protein
MATRQGQMLCNLGPRADYCRSCQAAINVDQRPPAAQNQAGKRSATNSTCTLLDYLCLYDGLKLVVYH